MTFDKIKVKKVLSAEKSRLVRIVVAAEVAIDKNKFVANEKIITEWLQDNVGKYCWYHPLDQVLELSLSGEFDFEHDGGNWSTRYGTRLKTDDHTKIYFWFAPSFKNQMMLFKLKWGG